MNEEFPVSTPDSDEAFPEKRPAPRKDPVTKLLESTVPDVAAWKAAFAEAGIHGIGDFNSVRIQQVTRRMVARTVRAIQQATQEKE